MIKKIPGILKAISTLKVLKPYKKNIDIASQKGDLKTEAEYILKATSTWGKEVAKRFKIDITVKGEENLPAEGPVLFVANHQGFADVPVLCAVLDKLPLAFVSKEEIKKLPIYGKWLKRIRCIFLKRDDGRASLKAISNGIKNIDEGFSMVIFPEGTRSQGGPMIAFKKGALKLATKPKVPIVPITINGTFKVFEETGYAKPASVNVLIHPLFETANLTREEEKQLPYKVFNSIYQGLLTLKD